MLYCPKCLKSKLGVTKTLGAETQKDDVLPKALKHRIYRIRKCESCKESFKTVELFQLDLRIFLKDLDHEMSLMNAEIDRLDTSELVEALKIIIKAGTVPEPELITEKEEDFR